MKIMFVFKDIESATAILLKKQQQRFVSLKWSLTKNQ